MKPLLDRATRRFTASSPVGYVPNNSWLKCSACRTLIFRRQLLDNLKVCPTCEHHFRLSTDEWLALLLDANSFAEHEQDLAPGDPLSFVHAQTSYPEKIEQAQQRAGTSEALICGAGWLDGQELELAVANFDFMGGSMGSVYGEKIARSAERAAARGVPLVTVNASGGARMQEGLYALMQMAKVSLTLQLLAQARQPHIAILADPCYGGVAASYATASDIVIAEPGAHIGFAGPRVIAQTIRQQLPPGFQTAEFLLEHGMIDAVVPRQQMRGTLAQLLRTYRADMRSE